jgi:hypothetical protein
MDVVVRGVDVSRRPGSTPVGAGLADDGDELTHQPLYAHDARRCGRRLRRLTVPGGAAHPGLCGGRRVLCYGGQVAVLISVDVFGA